MTTKLDEMTRIYPEKFAPEDKMFSHIHRGARIFIGTGCGEPQYLVHALINYVESHPKAFFDAEVFHSKWVRDKMAVKFAERHIQTPECNGKRYAVKIF